MAITDNAAHALLIDGEDIATARSRTVVDPATGEPIAEGARAERGGEIVEGPGAFYTPTIIEGALQGSEIVQHEVFGPCWPYWASRAMTRPSHWPTTRGTG